MKIIFSWGGSWWHIYPSMAIASRINWDFLFVVWKSKLEKDILEKSWYKYKQILSWKIRRYFDLNNFIDPFKIIIWIIQSLFIIKSFRPEKIFCKWWFVSLPMAIAWRIMWVDIILHESDMKMWLANKIISKFAKKIIYWIKENCNPVREIKYTVNKAKIENDIKKLNDKNLPILFITWWSQWAEQLNKLVLEIYSEIKDKFFVIHLTWKWKSTKLVDKNYLQFEFLNEEYFDYLSIADLVISRAWAGSIAEILYFNLPSILIPLDSSAQDHQRENAKYIANQWLSFYIDPLDLNKNKVLEILNNKNSINLMKDNLYKIKNNNPLEKIIEIIKQ